MTDNNTSRMLLIAILAVVALGVGYYVLNMPDQRTGAQHIGDAIGELPNGVDKAARELKDRTPAQKIGDEIKDATHK
ncbi:MAG TPA: hypothetical protein VHB73_08025 [Alphaproteobacteria bacterium]|nr:hypothetical protein [Alphaproteobacteria bacterium]